MERSALPLILGICTYFLVFSLGKAWVMLREEPEDKLRYKRKWEVVA